MKAHTRQPIIFKSISELMRHFELAKLLLRLIENAKDILSTSKLNIAEIAAQTCHPARSGNPFHCPLLLNKKNSFRKIWNDQKIIPIFAMQKKLNMRHMQIHIKTETRFSPKGDDTGRGACSAIE